MTLFDLVGKTSSDGQVDNSYREVAAHKLEKIIIDQGNILFLCEDGVEYTVGSDKHNEFLVSEEDEYCHFKIEIMDDDDIISRFIEKYR